MVYRMASFSMTLNDPKPRFQSHTIMRMSFRMTLSDLAKYSMTQSVARSLCDSWASCYFLNISVAVWSQPGLSVCSW